MLLFPLSFFFHSFFLLIPFFNSFYFLCSSSSSTSSRIPTPFVMQPQHPPPQELSPEACRPERCRRSPLRREVRCLRASPLSKLPFRVDARPKLFEFSDMLRYRCTAAFIAPRFIALFMLISVLQYHSISFYKRFVAFLSLYICFIHHASATSILHLSLFCASIHFLIFLFFFFFLFFYPLSFLLLAFKRRR